MPWLEFEEIWNVRTDHIGFDSLLIALVTFTPGVTLDFMKTRIDERL